ncbi:MAG: hypothetical protein HS114_12615 [Anaerolineales bacterium]|nr:hypothetical protein [Anaerolineales bacterium]
MARVEVGGRAGVEAASVAEAGGRAAVQVEVLPFSAAARPGRAQQPVAFDNGKATGR